MPEDKTPETATPAPPPAAEVVLTGEQTEEVNTLKKKLEEKDGTIKSREQRINQLEDENRRLKDIPKTTPKTTTETPAPAAAKKSGGFGFFRE